MSKGCWITKGLAGSASLVWDQLIWISCIFSFTDPVSMGGHCLGQQLEADGPDPTNTFKDFACMWHVPHLLRFL